MKKAKRNPVAYQLRDRKFHQRIVKSKKKKTRAQLKNEIGND